MELTVKVNQKLLMQLCSFEQRNTSSTITNRFPRVLHLPEGLGILEALPFSRYLWRGSILSTAKTRQQQRYSNHLISAKGTAKLVFLHQRKNMWQTLMAPVVKRASGLFINSELSLLAAPVKGHFFILQQFWGHLYHHCPWPQENMRFLLFTHFK